MKMRDLTFIVIAVSTGEARLMAESPLGTAFTYQGHLNDGGSPASGPHNFAFSLWDDALAGAQIGPTLTYDGLGGNPPPINVTDGLFTVRLNFGEAAFNGSARWLEIVVNGTPLVPRQPLMPSPYALALPGLYTQENATSPNVIGGYSGNAVTPGLVGATIGGGGSPLDGLNNRVTSHYGTVGGGSDNQAGADDEAAWSDHATVSGGFSNAATSVWSTVGGGILNAASGPNATVAGGQQNSAEGHSSTVSGGAGNTGSGNGATVGGGQGNSASDFGSTVGGGLGNLADGYASTVGGGYQNSASNGFSTVPGGALNEATGYSSFAAGHRAKAIHDGSFVWGDATSLDFASTAANQFLIRAGGGVGIGTNNPQARLHTVGGPNYNHARFESNSTEGTWMRLVNTVASGRDWGLLTTGTTNLEPVGSFVIRDNTAPAVRMMIDPAGNVGIGTIAPGMSLEVAGPPNYYSTPSLGVSFDQSHYLYLHAAPNPSMIWPATGALRFGSETSRGSGYTEHMRITSSGKVGIGTGTPTEQLHVQEGILVDGAGAANGPPSDVQPFFGLRMGGLTSGEGIGSNRPGGSPNRLGIDLYTARLSRMSITNNGNVGIGTQSPSQRLHVVGNICATGTIGTCSDARFKEHVEPIAGALEKVEQLRGVNFDWKREAFPDHKFAKDRQLGFIAQEVEKVLPHVVSRGEDGYLSVDYGRLTPVLVEALRELRDEKDQQIARRDGQIAELTQRLERMEVLIEQVAIDTKGAGR
ncbi:MAG: hypothetical protein DCC65_05545 [Planctomycetota bacterium]|nr:MAG: hypothetical protein DCC65_05545 [Planctomycetota bacterium]